MAVLNTYGQETVWWQTVIQVILFPILFLIILTLIGGFMMFFGHFDSVLGFISRFFQFGLSSFFALSLPILFLKSSNELVASVICGTLLFIALVAPSLFVMLNISGVTHSFSELLDLLALLSGAMIGVGVFYKGIR